MLIVNRGPGGAIKIATLGTTEYMYLLLCDGKSEPSNFQIIQNVTTSAPHGPGTKAGKQYLDPQPPDDDKPFYYTDKQLPLITNKLGQDILFLDDPKRPLSFGNGTYWKGELSVVEKGTDDKYKPLITLTYGYTIKDKAANPYPIIITDPSAFQLNALK